MNASEHSISKRVPAASGESTRVSEDPTGFGELKEFLPHAVSLPLFTKDVPSEASEPGFFDSFVRDIEPEATVNSLWLSQTSLQLDEQEFSAFLSNLNKSSESEELRPARLSRVKIGRTQSEVCIEASYSFPFKF